MKVGKQISREELCPLLKTEHYSFIFTDKHMVVAHCFTDTFSSS